MPKSAVAVLVLALCAAFASTQEFQLEFVPASEMPGEGPPNIFQAAMERMEALSHNMAEAMNENVVDASRPMKRGRTVKEEFSPMPGVQVELEMQTAGPGPMDDPPRPQPRPRPPAPESFLEMMRQRAETMAKRLAKNRQMFAERMKERVKRLKTGIMHRLRKTDLPPWMRKLSPKSRFFHAKRMRMAWLRKAVSAQCGSDELEFCPGVKCPKKLAKCLTRHQDEVTEQCGKFLIKWHEFKHMKKQAAKKAKKARKHCRSLDDKEQDDCFESVREEKKSTMKALRKKFVQLKNQDEKSDLKDAAPKETVAGKVEKTIKDKMAGLETMLQGLVKHATQPTEESSGCTKDSCSKGGDMGSYCKANKDCHCTQPFFSTTGTTCKLSCTPTSSTPCCRNDDDCKANGDTGAYCKSPKSTPHTTPGNGMCRCSPGFEGTTRCKKSKSKSKSKAEPKKVADFNEGTPAYLTGDVEAPKGEKDMGGWTMAVYTPEQQARLGLDEVGKPAAKAVKQDKVAESSKNSNWSAWMMDHLIVILGVGALLALLLTASIVTIYRFHSMRQSVELRAVYNSAMTAVPTEVSAIKQDSANQI